MATARATYTWVAYEAAFRARMGIATGRAAELEGLLALAASACDQFLGNPFDGTVGISPGEHPPDIWEGIVAWSTTTLRLGAATAGLTSATTGGITEQYGMGLDPARAKLEAARDAWLPWKRGVWR